MDLEFLTNYSEKERDHFISFIKDILAGIDEIALFIMTPIPGSRAFEYSPGGYKNLSQLTFSPKWRKTYHKLSRTRIEIYILFFLWKLKYHPIKVFKQIKNILTKDFRTKMEMALWRVIRIHIKIKLVGRLRGLLVW